jgi:hypothetical protein
MSGQRASASAAHLAAQGVHGVGSREYSEEQYALVVETFLVQDAPVTVAQLHAVTGVPGRTVRQIMSAADGVAFVLGGSSQDGYRRATDPAEARRLSQQLGSQVRTMSARLARRDQLTLDTWGVL